MIDRNYFDTLCFGGDSPLGYVKNKVSATTTLSSKMIQLNRTTSGRFFSQYISEDMAFKICSLKYFEQCIIFIALSHERIRVCKEWS